MDNYIPSLRKLLKTIQKNKESVVEHTDRTFPHESLYGQSGFIIFATERYQTKCQ